jgi:hypothetical protein
MRLWERSRLYNELYNLNSSKYPGDLIKKNEMDGVEERCIQRFGGET